MDSRRFDQLTRSLAASGTSRRSVVGTLLAVAGSLLLPRRGAAVCIPPGKACEQGDACCSGHTCFEAVCDCPSGIFDDQGTCAPPSPGCLKPGAACKPGDACCFGYTCFEGLCDCPSGYVDESGVCGSPPEPDPEPTPTDAPDPEPTCIPPGGPCAEGDACCDGHTCFEAVCDCPSGLVDAAGRCAPPSACEGDVCGADADCCEGLACLAGLCVPAQIEVVCLLEGGACASNADCCVDEGLTCQEGVCLPAITVQVGCSDVGGPCGVDRVCCASPATTCSADGVCACTSPLIPDRTGLTCVAVCGFPGEPCSDDLPCCGGAGACVDGVCRCPDDLRPCGATCVDPKVKYRRDVRNCGARGNACGKGEVCCEGVCVATEGFASDPDHCGGCCTACHPWEICCDGRCDQPFRDELREEDVCCEPERVCAPGDGTELCCAADEACHNGGCCRDDRICGETCCDEFSTCHCGRCVVELETCRGDGDCCGDRCVDGVCCPDQAICTAEDGSGFCCGIGQRCGPDPGTCVGDYPTRAIYPVRTPRRPG